MLTGPSTGTLGAQGTRVPNPLGTPQPHTFTRSHTWCPALIPYPQTGHLRAPHSFPPGPALPTTLLPLGWHTHPHPHLHTHTGTHTLRRHTLEVHTWPRSPLESHTQDSLPWWPPPGGPWATRAPGRLLSGRAGVSSCLGLAQAGGHGPRPWCGAEQPLCGLSQKSGCSHLGCCAWGWRQPTGGQPLPGRDTSLTFLERWGSLRRGKVSRPGPGPSLISYPSFLCDLGWHVLNLGLPL